MNAGRELDAQVAELVMGWKLGPSYLEPNPVEFFWNTGRAEPNDELSINDWNPSTSIQDAWLVVEEVGKRTGYGVEIEYPCGEEGTWQVRFEASVAGKWMGGFGEADTAPEAICMAALEALK